MTEDVDELANHLGVATAASGTQDERKAPVCNSRGAQHFDFVKTEVQLHPERIEEGLFRPPTNSFFTGVSTRIRVSARGF
jgi:hypothetical protein